MSFFKSRSRMIESVDERRELILSGNSLHALFRLSIPTLLMAFVQSMIPLSDGLFLNRAGGVIVASAVGYAQPVVNILTSVSQGLAVAATAVIGRSYGQGDYRAVRRAGSQVMVFGFGVGTLLAPVFVLIAYLLSLQVKAEISATLFTYLALNALVFPLLFMAAIFNGIKNATGQPEATFYRMVILLALKLLFNALFLSLLRWGAAGAVLASFCSYALLAVWMYYDLFIRVSELQLGLKGLRPDRPFLLSLLKLGLPVMLSNALINFGFFLVNTEIEVYGPAVLNAQTIAANVSSLAFTLPSAVGTTVTTMVAMNVGVGQLRQAKKVVRQALLFSLAIALALIALFYPLSEFLVSLFTEHREIAAIAVEALGIYMLSIVGFGIFMVAQGAYIGLGRMKITLLSGFVRVWLLRYLFILVAKAYWDMGAESVFWGNLFSNTLAGLIFAGFLMARPFKNALPSATEEAEAPSAAEEAEGGGAGRVGAPRK